MKLESLSIEDSQSGARARIMPRLGFNCYSFIAGAREPVEVLWADPDFRSGKTRPTRSGIPILFPFAGRIRGTSFEFAGQMRELEIGDDFGNAIHGFVLNRPWRVVEHDGATIVGQFQASLDDPALLTRWPADFRISVSYEVQGHALRCAIHITNPDERPLPFTLGTHQYFRVPLGSGGSADECRVTVPAHRQWELAGLLPTGKVIPAPVGPQLREGMPFWKTELDDVFTGLDYVEQRATATIYDPHHERTMRMTFDQQFRDCVVFNPPHREAICIEPYTAAPNPFELEAEGIDAGLRTLAPGQSFEAAIEMAME